MPPNMRERSEAVSRYLNFFVDALIVGLIAILLREISLGATTVGVHLKDWRRDSAIGTSAGVLLVASQWGMVKLVPPDPQHPFTSRVRKGGFLLWLFMFATGAFSEELWIAVCVVVLKAAGYSPALLVVMTSIVFAAVHYSYRFWGAVAVALKASVSALLFLHYGSLFVTFFFHFVGNLGSFYWSRYWRR
jgi:membrane protease YdiL (CAAX protease family)